MNHNLDLVRYSYDELSFLLLKQSDSYVFCYPWSKPIKKSVPIDEKEEKEEINIDEKDLFLKMCARSRFHAIDHLSSMAMATLNGEMPKSYEELQKSALKFALRRLEKNLITGKQFLSMLRSAGIVGTIPESFWDHLSKKIDSARVTKLKQSSEALSVFHKNERRVFEEMLLYVGTVLWYHNEFKLIARGAKQIALLSDNAEIQAGFATASSKAEGLMMRAEIEEEASKVKPWQRTVAPKIKRKVRSVPSSSQKHARADQKSDEKPQTDEGDD